MSLQTKCFFCGKAINHKNKVKLNINGSDIPLRSNNDLKTEQGHTCCVVCPNCTPEKQNQKRKEYEKKIMQLELQKERDNQIVSLLPQGTIQRFEQFKKLHEKLAQEERSFCSEFSITEGKIKNVLKNVPSIIDGEISSICKAIKTQKQLSKEQLQLLKTELETNYNKAQLLKVETDQKGEKICLYRGEELDELSEVQAKILKRRDKEIVYMEELHSEISSMEDVAKEK